MLTIPLSVKHDNGRLKVLTRRGRTIPEMGEALILDGVVNSIDAEVVALGDNGKNAPRGAIVRHGRYTQWAFSGGVEAMTEMGKRLFVNTAFYAASHADSPVLEIRRNQTRDALFGYIELARYRVPDLLQRLDRFLPAEIRGKSPTETQTYLEENRDYLHFEEPGFEVDRVAKRWGIANYKRDLIERCLANLKNGTETAESAALLTRYTGRRWGTSAGAWEKWYTENKDYLFFSDCQGSQFLIDEQAKAARIPTATLRNWSSEQIDYRVPRVSEAERNAPSGI